MRRIVESEAQGPPRALRVLKSNVCLCLKRVLAARGKPCTEIHNKHTVHNCFATRTEEESTVVLLSSTITQLPIDYLAKINIRSSIGKCLFPYLLYMTVTYHIKIP